MTIIMNAPIPMQPVGGEPMDIGDGLDARPFAEAFTMYATGNGSLEDVKQEIHKLITSGEPEG